MQRRRFLRLSGISAAALFFTRSYSGQTTAPAAVLHFPSRVAVLSGGQWTPLSGSKENWTFRQLNVRLAHAWDVLSVRLHAPGMEIQQLRLGWDSPFSPGCRYLGDQWERSYGDLAWNGPDPTRKAPWYLLVHDERQTLAFGVKTGARSICYWEAGPQHLELVLDLRSGGEGVLPGDRVLHAADIVTTQNTPGETPFQTDARFCKLMCDKPRLPVQPVYGINDWYFAYGNNSAALILESTRAMADLATDTNNRPFSVIDDGWQGEDFTAPNAKFGDMSSVASRIKGLGMRPGLWTRALLASGNDQPSRLIPLRKGEPSDSKERYIDPTIPENAHRIGAIIHGHRQWGFELVKHDYSTYDLFGRWGFDMKKELTAEGWHFHDRSKTNAEIVLALYETIREAAGPLYLIGCNTMSHLSAGVFELNRIGDDTSGKEWARTLKMGVNTMGFRLPQHNAFYAADGDCVGLTTQVPWEKNRQWMQLLAESGAPLFISAERAATGPEQREYVRTCFSHAARRQPTGEPLDWLTNPRPAKWRLNDKVVEFEW
jgi:alpha-galactosidase